MGQCQKPPNAGYQSFNYKHFPNFLASIRWAVLKKNTHLAIYVFLCLESVAFKRHIQREDIGRGLSCFCCRYFGSNLSLPPSWYSNNGPPSLPLRLFSLGVAGQCSPIILASKGRGLEPNQRTEKCVLLGCLFWSGKLYWKIVTRCKISE